MLVSWENYFNPPGALGAYTSCRQIRGPQFEGHRALIARIFEARQAHSVACLGAGILNDIPLAEFLMAGADVHLVDWLPDAPEFGVSRSIIERVENGEPSCLLCRLENTDIGDYCRAHRGGILLERRVCNGFEPGGGDPLTCNSFRRGTLPHIHRQDATGGFASAFGEAIGKEIAGAPNWRHAFRRATALAGRLKGHRRRLDIDDGSIDLVISSMLLSQFEHEPYEYFSKQVQSRLGTPAPGAEKRLRPSMEALRTALLTNQIDGHCDEIERIMAPDGRALVTFEMFHYDRDEKRWFLVSQMHGALGILAERFDFDFDSAPGEAMDNHFETPTGRSVVCHFVLKRRRHQTQRKSG